MVYLLQRHYNKGNPYYQDTGIDVGSFSSLCTNKYVDVRIMGMVWKLDQHSPYLVRVKRYGQTHWMAWIP